MYFLQQSGNVILAYDLEKFMVITGYSQPGNSGYIYSGKREFVDPQEALKSFSKAVTAGRQPIKKAAAFYVNFIHKHSGSIYEISGWAGMIFLILTAGASDSKSIGIGQTAIRGMAALMMVLFGIYGANHPYAENGIKK